MGRLEDHYLKNEAEVRSTRINETVKTYNEQARYVREMIPKIVAEIKVSPPKNYNWVYIDDQKYLAWPLSFHSGYEGDRPSDHGMIFYIMQDGKLINVQNKHSDKFEVIGYIYIRYIDKEHEMFRDDGQYKWRGGYNFEEKILNPSDLYYLNKSITDTYSDFAPRPAKKKRTGFFSRFF